MQAENKALIARWFEEVWNQQREDTIDELMAPEAIAHGLAHPDSVGKNGPAAFKPFFRAFSGAFPDIHIELITLLADDDMVSTHFRVTGTHTGEGLGVPPTGKTIDTTGTSTARIRNGQLVEGFNNVDLLTLFQQIGVLPLL